MATPQYNVPKLDDVVAVACLYCRAPLEVSRKALTVTCKVCHKPLKLEDVQIKVYEARRHIDTCGIVTVERKAHVVSEKINCGGIIIRGKVKATINSRGPVLIGPEAEIRGNITAPKLAVGAGAILDGKYEIGSGPA
jgi:hypothetical protein